MFEGPIIKTRYSGSTSRVIATHKPDSETSWRASTPWDPGLSAQANHKAAARKILPRFSGPMEFAGRGHDHDAYYWLAVGTWQQDHQDAAILNAITATLSGAEWSYKTFETIANLVRSTGRIIAEPEE